MRALRRPAEPTAVLLVALLLATGCGAGAGSRAGEGQGRTTILMGGEDEAERERPPVLTTEAVDEKVGKEEFERALEELGLVRDEALVGYVAGVGRSLARQAPGYRFEYSFRILDQEPPNAFALPGGYIFVSRGLLVLSNSEDELANVLAHEIIHVARRHAAARQLAVRPGLLQWLQMRDIAAYSRRQESEADRLGQGLAALAGFDPGGMASFLRGLDFTERVELGRSRIPGFLDTHPSVSGRAAAASNRASAISWRPADGADAPAAYLRRLEGLAVGPSASEGVFDGSRFLHADLAFTLRFPEGWELRNTHRAVGAFSPRRDAQVFLEHAGAGDDVREAAERDLEKFRGKGFRADASEPVRIAGSPGVRVRGQAIGPGGAQAVVLTWFPFQGSIYRMTGVAVAKAATYDPIFGNVARSFRPLSPELRARIRETRLRLVAAQGGESLKELSARTGNEWDLQRTAVMNDLYANARLESGQLVKVALSEPYTPQSAGSAKAISASPGSDHPWPPAATTMNWRASSPSR